MKFQQLIEKICVMEEAAAFIYGHISENSSGEIKDFCRKLKEQELSHVDELKSLAQEIISYSEIVPEDIVFLLEQAGELSKENIKEEKMDSIRDLVRYALEAEKKSIMLYGEMKNIFKPDSNGAKLFEKLIEEEKDHMFFILKVLHTLKGIL